jgi:excisionase family DNA binding protein
MEVQHMEVQQRNSSMLTTTEVAQFLHVHPNTVRRWANRGLLPTHRLGTRGDRRFRWEDLDNFIKSNGHN